MTKVYQSDDIKELAAALAKAQGAMKHAEKGTENPYFKSKYADLAACIDAAKSALADNGLSVTQLTDIDEVGNVVLITQLNHSSGQWIRGWYPVKPVKADPQGLGSAITYGRRYAYCSITGVAASGEDDDGNAGSGRNGNHAKESGVFESASARNMFIASCGVAIGTAGTLASLKELKTLYLKQWMSLKESDVPADVDAYGKVSAEYNERFKVLQAKDVKPKSVDSLTAKSDPLDGDDIPWK